MPQKLKLEDLNSPLLDRTKRGDPFQTVGVIGLGVMGTGIAETVAEAGIEVIALEKSEILLKRGMDSLAKAIDVQIKRWAKTSSDKRAILSRIRGTTDFAELSRCNIVIEAVDEIFELKKNIIETFYSVGKADAVFISNTGTLSLTKLGQASRNPEQLIGMHFLNPVPTIPLVEIVRGMYTSDKTFDLVKRFALRIGKTPVEVFEYPGFITTRVIIPLLNEAMHVLMEGIAKAEDIDTAMRLGYSMQIGPLELADSIGLDEVLMWMETLFRDLGEPRYRPCPLLRRMVREGKLGKSVSQGFFTYNEDGKRL